MVGAGANPVPNRVIATTVPTNFVQAFLAITGPVCCSRNLVYGPLTYRSTSGFRIRGFVTRPFPIVCVDANLPHPGHFLYDAICYSWIISTDDLTSRFFILISEMRRPQDAMKVTEHIAAYHDSALVLNPTPFRLL